MSGTQDRDGGGLQAVHDYHQRTKHRPDRYAASPGFMDWDNQPSPFRRFTGAETIDLPHPEIRKHPTYDALFSRPPPAEPLCADLVGRLFYHSLALSAWKQSPGGTRWSLRINPSSGDLHPTEGYLISGPVADLVAQPGVFHYDVYGHRLERRCRYSAQDWAALTEGLSEPRLLIGLSSVFWRESWKYGERAFRYCHHDVGHAIGAIACAARTLGWETRLLDIPEDDALDRLIGTHQQTGMEREHGDCLLALYPGGPVPAASVPSIQWKNRIPDVPFTGTPNRLSRDHLAWPIIDAISFQTRRAAESAFEPDALVPAPAPMDRATAPDRGHSAEGIIRQRRSAVSMDGITGLDETTFYRMLSRTLPGQFPFVALPWQPRVSLAIFVHRVDGLEPGLYLLARDPSQEASLRQVLRSDFEWKTPAGCARGFPLFRMMVGDLRRTASALSCQQTIAGNGAFSLGMLAQFRDTLVAEGPSFYPRLFWETGLIGQVLYLEAEAAGMRGTGIGCFFDDAVHALLGIDDFQWQTLYHFTAGGPVEDPRLVTEPPYAHLPHRRPGSGTDIPTGN